MKESVKSQPGVPELFQASLIATALVYSSGAVIFAGLSFLGTQSGEWLAVVQTLLVFATLGVIVAAGLAFLIIAPLGTAYGLAILRVSPPGWWQGPLTGALVVLSLEAFVILVVAQEALEWEWGNLIMLSIPAILAMTAGGYVQHKILRWPQRG